jgi:hypothetical protein
MFLSAVADHGADPTAAFEAAALALEAAEFYEALDGALAILEDDIARSAGLPPCGPAARQAMFAILEEHGRRIAHEIQLSLDGVPEDEIRRQTRPLLPGDWFRSTFIPSQELVEPGTGGGWTNPVADTAREPRAPRVGTVKARGKGKAKVRHKGRRVRTRLRFGKLRVPKKRRTLS